MLRTIPLIVSGLLSLTTAIPTSYPRALPTTFYIERFTLFSPTGSNTNPPEITFTYYDPTTNITTPCIYNGVVDPTVSYPCSNTVVSFQWNKTSSTLSVEETLAPEEEIFGNIGIGTYCYPIEPPVPYGYGTECQPPGDGGSLSGSFTSAVA